MFTKTHKQTQDRGMLYVASTFVQLFTNTASLEDTCPTSRLQQELCPNTSNDGERRLLRHQQHNVNDTALSTAYCRRDQQLRHRHRLSGVYIAEAAGRTLLWKLPVYVASSLSKSTKQNISTRLLCDNPRDFREAPARLRQNISVKHCTACP